MSILSLTLMGITLFGISCAKEKINKLVAE